MSVCLSIADGYRAAHLSELQEQHAAAQEQVSPSEL
jgi:hypothetical protein